MTDLEKIKEICKSHDFKSQRDILSEEISEMIMVMSALSVNYYDQFINKPTLECYCWLDALVDLDICMTQMSIYLGCDSMENYLYLHEDTISGNLESMLEHKDDIYILSYLNKTISKARRNDKVGDVRECYELFVGALYFAERRFINNAKETLRSKGLIEYYDKLFSEKLDRIIKKFEEECK